jgi:glycogen operon protein
VKDISWLQPDGSEMTDEAWTEDDRLIGVYIAGAAADLLDVRGDPVTDNNMLLLLNGRDEEVSFSLPAFGRRRGGWRVVLDSARPRENTTPVRGKSYTAASRSIVVLAQPSGL